MLLLAGRRALPAEAILLYTTHRQIGCQLSWAQEKNFYPVPCCAGGNTQTRETGVASSFRAHWLAGGRDTVRENNTHLPEEAGGRACC